MRIGLYGGSFNPPTIAHKALADFIFKSVNLDKLYWMISPQNPLKDPHTLAAFPHRLAMVQKILDGDPNMVASDLEERLGSSWTINTVRYLKNENPEDELYLFMGADNWLRFHEWGDDRAAIFDYVSIIVMPRPGYEGLMDCPSSHQFKDFFVSNVDQIKPTESWTILESPIIDVAATDVREAATHAEKHPHIEDAIWDYIVKHRLYGMK